jgi:hypothetical protein
LFSIASGDSDAPPDDSTAVAVEAQDGSELAVAEDGTPAVAVPAMAGMQRDTTPTVPPQPKKSAVLNDRADVGNIGFLFGNWGSRASDKEVQANIDRQLKHGLAAIIGLCECQKATEDNLAAPAVAEQPGEEGSLESRQGYEYLTVRGKEEKSVLIGVRSNQANGIKLLNWQRRLEGEYKNTGGGRSYAYTRCLVVEIDLKQHVGFIGPQLRVMTLHIHNHVANKAKGFRMRLDELWPWIKTKITLFNVDVLMGDFNMSLFKVIPELRSRGIIIDLGAWYPWRNEQGTPMADSGGIFFINKKASYELYVGLDRLHAENEHGIGWAGKTAAVSSKYARHSSNAGPGQSLGTYLPKSESFEEKLSPTLTQTYTVEALNAAVAGADEQETKKAPGRTHLTFREKRLDVEKWLYKGENYRGSHFPLCVFTNNVGRRSEDRFIARKERGKNQWKKHNDTAYRAVAPQSRQQWQGSKTQAPATDHVPQAKWNDHAQGSQWNATDEPWSQQDHSSGSWQELQRRGDG